MTNDPFLKQQERTWTLYHHLDHLSQKDFYMKMMELLPDPRMLPSLPVSQTPLRALLPLLRPTRRNRNLRVT
jgi:hypothetical protein